jgi:hypothetical protein
MSNVLYSFTDMFIGLAMGEPSAYMDISIVTTPVNPSTFFRNPLSLRPMLKSRGFDGESFAFLPVHHKDRSIAHQTSPQKDGGVGREAAIPEPDLCDGQVIPIHDEVAVAFNKYERIPLYAHTVGQ